MFANLRAFLFVSICLTFLGFSSILLADQSQQCSGLLTPKKVMDPLVIATRALHTESVKFEDLFDSRIRGEITLEQLKVAIEKITAATAAYLDLAGVTYKKMLAHVPAEELWGVKVPAFTYTQFKIVSGSKKTVFSRRVAGLLQHKRLPGLEIIFDPMMTLSKPGFAAAYRESQIFITYNAPSLFALGLADSLRHEAQHALEDAKLGEGRPTLANFAFKMGKMQGSYSQFMSFDEVEAYLRDLRFVKKIGPRTKPWFDDPWDLVDLDVNRARQIEDTVGMIRELIKRGRDVLSELKDLGRAEMFHKEKNYMLLYENLKDGEDPIETQEKAIEWSEKRLLEIEKELSDYVIVEDAKL